MTDEVLLPELVRRESRSFLQYVRESYPWAKGPSETMLRESILRMADAEAEHSARLGRLLQKRHIPLPGLGASTATSSTPSRWCPSCSPPSAGRWPSWSATSRSSVTTTSVLRWSPIAI